jgi:hypothetical protein
MFVLDRCHSSTTGDATEEAKSALNLNNLCIRNRPVQTQTGSGVCPGPPLNVPWPWIARVESHFPKFPFRHHELLNSTLQHALTENAGNAGNALKPLRLVAWICHTVPWNHSPEPC